jgi:hypothetical protein
MYTLDVFTTDQQRLLLLKEYGDQLRKQDSVLQGPCTNTTLAETVAMVGVQLDSSGVKPAAAGATTVEFYQQVE